MVGDPKEDGCSDNNCSQCKKKRFLSLIWPDDMTWQWFLHTGPLVRGIHRPPVYTLHKAPVMPSLNAPFFVNLNKLTNKQSSSWWFHPSWHACDVIVMTILSSIQTPILKFSSPPAPPPTTTPPPHTSTPTPPQPTHTHTNSHTPILFACSDDATSGCWVLSGNIHARSGGFWVRRHSVPIRHCHSPW